MWPGSVRTHKSFQSVQATVSRSRDPRRMSTVGPPRPGWGILTPFLSDSRRAPHKASMSSSSSKCACWKTTRQIKACSSCKHGSSLEDREAPSLHPSRSASDVSHEGPLGSGDVSSDLCSSKTSLLPACWMSWSRTLCRAASATAALTSARLTDNLLRADFARRAQAGRACVTAARPSARGCARHAAESARAPRAWPRQVSSPRTPARCPR